MWHKNPDNLLVEPGDRAFWRGFWRTDAFRALLDDPATGYAAFMERVAQRPWWFIQPTQDYERRHFAPWFAQALIRREYPNKLVEDLYYWHDLVHALTFLDASDATEEEWRLGMRSNEINTSLETEVLIYWRAPSLRAQTFDHPIWMDEITGKVDPESDQRLADYRARLLKSPASQEAIHEKALRASLPQGLLPYAFPNYASAPDFETLWDRRRATSIAPRAGNAVEEDLARYEATADPFYAAWSGLWQKVEKERAQFDAFCKAGQWKEAVRTRSASWEASSNEDGVPYGDLAKSLA